MGKMLGEPGSIRQAMKRAASVLVAAGALGMASLFGAGPAQAFLYINPGDTWLSTSGVAGSPSGAGPYDSVTWTSDNGHNVTLTAFHLQLGSVASSKVTQDTSLGHPGFGVCSVNETCSGDSNQINFNKITIGSGADQIHTTNLDVLQVSFANGSWVPLGASFTATDNNLSFVIYGNNGGDLFDANGDIDTSNNTLLGFQVGASTAQCPTSGSFSSSSPLFTCYQSGNDDQFEFADANGVNQTAFQNLFFLVDTTNSDANGSPSFLLHDIEGVLPTSVPEPLTLSLFGAGLVGLGLARRRRGVSAR